MITSAIVQLKRINYTTDVDNTPDVYTKTEVDGIETGLQQEIDDKVETTTYNSFSGSVNTELGTKADTTYVDTEINSLSGSVATDLSDKADTTYVNTEINTLSGSVETELNARVPISPDFSGDMDTVKTTSTFRVNNTATNLPTPSTFWSAIVYGNGSNVVSQTVTHFQNGTSYVRSFNNSWSAWTSVTQDTVYDDTSIQADIDTKADKSLTINGNSLTSSFNLDKTDVGLSNVNNTADSAKPVSTAQQTALNLKANDTDVVKLTGAQTILGDKSFSDNVTVDGSVEFNDEIDYTNAQLINFPKADIALENVDNTSDINKPISSATQTALNLKAATSYVDTQIASRVPTTRTVNGQSLSSDITIEASDVGLGNVDNTADSLKPLSAATINALADKQDILTRFAAPGAPGNQTLGTKGTVQWKTPLVGNADWTSASSTWTNNSGSNAIVKVKGSIMCKSNNIGNDFTIVYNPAGSGSNIDNKMLNGIPTANGPTIYHFESWIAVDAGGTLKTEATNLIVYAASTTAGANGEVNNAYISYEIYS